MGRRRRGHRGDRRRPAPAARLGDEHDLPGPVRVAAPVLPDRRPARRGRARAQQGLEGRRPHRGHRHARQGGHPQPRATRRRLPPPAVRWHAPARDDRHGAHQQPGAAHRRRAHHRPGRDRPGADHGAARRAPGAVQHRDHPHHPRPRRRRGRRRRGRRDVRGPARRARHPQRHLLLAGDAVHRGTARVGASPRCGERAPDADRGRAPVAHQPALGLRVQPTVHARSRGSADDRCTTERPELLQATSTHAVRCHLDKSQRDQFAAETLAAAAGRAGGVA